MDDHQCVACMVLVRECTADCEFARYYSDEQTFRNVHEVFGALKVGQVLEEIGRQERRRAVQMINEEAALRLSSPNSSLVGDFPSMMQRLMELYNSVHHVQRRLIEFVGTLGPIAEPQTYLTRPLQQAQKLQLSSGNMYLTIRQEKEEILRELVLLHKLWILFSQGRPQDLEQQQQQEQYQKQFQDLQGRQQKVAQSVQRHQEEVAPTLQRFQRYIAEVQMQHQGFLLSLLQPLAPQILAPEQQEFQQQQRLTIQQIANQLIELRKNRLGFNQQVPMARFEEVYVNLLVAHPLELDDQ